MGRGFWWDMRPLDLREIGYSAAGRRQIAVSDEGSEIFERSLQLREAAGSEGVRDPLFRCSRVTMDGLLELASFLGESNNAGAPVVGIGLAGEVAVLIEVAE